jgi:adenine-specific DNA-methyltransferase
LAKTSNDINVVYTNDKNLIRNGYNIIIRPPKKSKQLGRWTWSFDKFNNEKDLIYIKDRKSLFKKIYVDNPNNNNSIETETYLPPKSIIEESSSLGTKLVNEILENKIFDNPKPISLINHLLTISTSQSSQILDFFAGSGTTAHATLKLNADEKVKYAIENQEKLQKGEISKKGFLQELKNIGNRKFILAQLPEYTDEKSEAFKAGYQTIADICIERVKRAGKKIIEEIKENKKLNDNLKEEIINNLDFGFKNYELSDTNIDKKYYEMGDDNSLNEYLEKADQLSFFDNEDGDLQEKLLYEIAIKNGFDLSVNFEKINDITTNNIYQINANNRESALISVDKNIKLESITKISEITLKNNQNWQFYCFDNALDITVKINLKSKVKLMII